jgi:hypothetical protein
MELETAGYSAGDMRRMLATIQKFTADYKLSSEAAFKDSVTVMKDMTSAGLSVIKNRTFSKLTGNPKADLAVAGICAAAGVVAVVGAGIGNYFDSLSTNSKIKIQYLKNEAEIITKGFPAVRKNKEKVEMLMEREKEINLTISGALERYSKIFYAVYSDLFPPQDKTKSKTARRKREKRGGSFYTHEEFTKIGNLRRFAKILGQIVDAEI